jgi:hypothetical protein
VLSTRCFVQITIRTGHNIEFRLRCRLDRQANRCDEAFGVGDVLFQESEFTPEPRKPLKTQFRMAQQLGMLFDGDGP